MDSEFTAKVSRMGHKRMINIPAKNKHFNPGDIVEVKKAIGTTLEKEAAK